MIDEKARIQALVEMIRRRIGQDYDGEAHFAEHEALQIADALASLTAPTRAEIAQVQPAPAGMPRVEDVAREISRVMDRDNHAVATQSALRILALFAPLAQENEKLKAAAGAARAWCIAKGLDPDFHWDGIKNWQLVSLADRAGDQQVADLKADLAEAEARVAQAVEEEREACAQVAERYDQCPGDDSVMGPVMVGQVAVAQSIAAAIRSGEAP